METIIRTWNKKDPVDEIRHEEVHNSDFTLD
jgi:hypothetical protein